MPNTITRKVYLTFPAEKTKETIICDMYDKFKVRFNIRTASVTKQVGLIGLELEGTADQVEKALGYFQSRGLSVEPVELDVIEG